MKKKLYKIVKYFKDPKKQSRVVEKGLTLEEAKRYCSREDTQKPGKWFCGFTEQ